MTPDWSTADGRIQLYRADCLEVLPQLDVSAIGACVTDPPYGISYVKGKSGGQGAYRGLVGDARLSRHHDPVIGDSQPFDHAHLLTRFENVLMFGANHYAARLPEGKGRWLAWNKLEHLESFDSFSDVEFAWHSIGRASRICNFMWKGGLACRKLGEDNGRRYHPTQKPVGVMEWCIRQSGDVETIIDPYMGTGTTLVACLRTGRRGIGIEIDPTYFDIAVKRIEAELNRMPLFEPPPIVQTQLPLMDPTAENAGD